MTKNKGCGATVEQSETEAVQQQQPGISSLASLGRQEDVQHMPTDLLDEPRRGSFCPNSTSGLSGMVPGQTWCSIEHLQVASICFPHVLHVNRDLDSSWLHLSFENIYALLWIPRLFALENTVF